MSSDSIAPVFLEYEKSIQDEGISRTGEYSVEVAKESQMHQPFFSIIMRTQTSRSTLMEQALLCLVAQNFQDFELVITAHDANREQVESVKRLVDSFGSQLDSKVCIVNVIGGLRGVPLNEGIDQAHGKYIVFLDDDDLVFADWLSEFKKAADEHPGKIIRSRCLDRFVKKVDNPDIPSYVQSGLIDSRARTFSLTQHFFISQTVLHSYATPRSGILQQKSYFDESYPVVEDWDFLLRNAELWGVVDTDSLTCIYNRWVNAGSSLHEHDASTWKELHNKVFTRFRQRGLLIGPEELTELYRMWLEHERFKDIAASFLRHGDGLMVNKKENALSRTVQYAQYSSTDVPTTKKMATKNFVKAFLPKFLYPTIRKLRKS